MNLNQTGDIADVNDADLSKSEFTNEKLSGALLTHIKVTGASFNYAN